MKHLEIDEIIEFVSAEKIDDNFMKIAATVNGHILKCKACREKVRAFQLVYDELKGLALEDGESFEDHCKVAKDQLKKSSGKIGNISLEK